MNNNLLKKVLLLGPVILAVLMQPAHANPVSRRAIITGVGGNGRCTIEVTVDGRAEIEVSGDNGVLTTIGGQPAVWRRFQCNAPLPSNPVDFRFARVNGRGTLRLLQDPRSTRGRAVVHIDDHRSGSAAYTFDLQWRGPGRDGWTPGPPPPPPGQEPGPGPYPGPGTHPGGFPKARAVRFCQDSVTTRLNEKGYQYVNFEQTIPVDNPGQNDWIKGTVNGKHWFGTTWFSFSCSADFSSGRVRSVDVHRRW
jgi:hypothetical protein